MPNASLPWRWGLLLSAMTAMVSFGCAAFYHIGSVPVYGVPAELRGESRANKETIDLVLLRQDPPKQYRLGPKDVLGIYIDGLLGDVTETAPVYLPVERNAPPAIGDPVPVRQDGTIVLPLVDPIKVAGLSLAQTKEAIRKAYTVGRLILQPGSDQVSVSLIRPRTYQVLVVRQDSGGPISVGGQGNSGIIVGSTKRGTGHWVDLPAYKNDVLHALTATGGLPGLDAVNEVRILRGKFADAQKRQARLAQPAETDESSDIPPAWLEDPLMVRIPLRVGPGEVPQFTQDDIILQDGDIVFIESRDSEVFYAGGLLGGGEYPLPRDYDLDVLGAVAVAGGPVVAGAGDGGGFGRGHWVASTPVVPSEVIILRRTPGGGQIPIEVDLRDTLKDPGERILIQPGDVIILRHTVPQAVADFLMRLVRLDIFVGQQAF